MILKLKNFTFILLMVTSVSLFAQEGTAQTPAEENKELSYFSQEEMEFILGDKDRPWNYGRLSIAPFYLVGIGDLANVISPFIAGFVVAFDHGIHHAFQPTYRKKSPFIPGIKIQGEFNAYGQLPITSIGISGGLVWLFPINEGRGGEVIVSSTAGMKFMRGAIGTYTYSNDSFFFDGTLGYELSFSRIFISLESRFLYIYDEVLPLMGVGGSLGVGYRFPSASDSGQGGEEK